MTASAAATTEKARPASKGEFLHNGSRVRPLRDKVFVRIDPIHECRSASGLLILPATRKVGESMLLTGRVVAVGPGRVVGSRFVETTCKVGDRVGLNHYMGEEIKAFDEDEFTTIVYDDMLLVGLAEDAVVSP